MRDDERGNGVFGLFFFRGLVYEFSFYKLGLKLGFWVVCFFRGGRVRRRKVISMGLWKYYKICRFF